MEPRTKRENNLKGKKSNLDLRINFNQSSLSFTIQVEPLNRDANCNVTEVQLLNPNKIKSPKKIIIKKS